MWTKYGLKYHLKKPDKTTIKLLSPLPGGIDI